MICAFVAVDFYSFTLFSQLLFAFVLPRKRLRMKDETHDRKIWVTCDICTLVLSPGVKTLQTWLMAYRSHRLGSHYQTRLTGQAVRKAPASPSSCREHLSTGHHQVRTLSGGASLRSTAPPSRRQNVSLGKCHLWEGFATLMSHTSDLTSHLISFHILQLYHIYDPTLFFIDEQFGEIFNQYGLAAFSTVTSQLRFWVQITVGGGFLFGVLPLVIWVLSGYPQPKSMHLQGKVN